MKKKIGYFILVIVILFLYIWTNQKYTIWIAAVMLAIVIPVVLIGRLSAGKVGIAFDVKSETREKTEVLLQVRNQSVFPVSRIDITFLCQNVAFASECETKVSCCVGRKKLQEYTVPVSSRYSGRINMEIERIEVFDWLGLSKRRIKSEKDCYFYRYPRNVSQELLDAEENKDCEEGIQYQHRKGNDITEILQIREYVKGDNIKNIHWKMSAKLGKLMMKEADTPNDHSVMLFFDYAPVTEKDINQRLIDAVAAISRELVKNTTGHTIYRMDTRENRVVHREVFTMDEYDIAIREILDTEIRKGDRSVVDHVMEKQIHRNYAKLIFVTYEQNRDGIGELEALEKCVTVFVSEAEIFHKNS